MKRRICAVLAAILFLATPTNAKAEVYWPEGPSINTQSAIVIEVNSGAVLFEKIAREMISKKTGKVTSNNVDYYSGFAYDMLNIPKEIYTPLFACAREVGWLAHNIENKLYDGKIMRPATKYVGEPVEFKPVEVRK